MAGVQKSVLIFYSAIISFLSGVFLYSFFNFGIVLPGLLLCASVIPLMFVIAKRSHTAFMVLVCLIFMMLGCIRVLAVSEVQAPFVSLSGNQAQITGEVIEDPDERDTSLHVVVRTHEINGVESRGVLLATLDRNSDIAYGDTVRLTGKLQLPKAFETTTGKVFDYPGYLRAKGIGATMTFPKLHIEKHAGFTLLGPLYSLKRALEHSIELTLPEPAAGLLEGILLGNKAALGNSLYQIFIVAGLVHIVVLSGYNLTIVSDALMRVSSRFSKKMSLSIGAVGIILFALMVGGGATVIRASIMALIVIAARALNRPAEVMRALALAGAVMVLQNPLILTHDPSFILSFLAAFGLMTFALALENKLSFVPEMWGMRGVVSATLATQIFLLPALIFYSGQISLVALPANLLALPLIPPIMLLGFLTGVIGLIHPYLAFPLMIPAWALLSLVVFIANTAAAIPSASVTVSGLQSPYIFALYIFLVPLALLAYNKTTSHEK